MRLGAIIKVLIVFFLILLVISAIVRCSRTATKQIAQPQQPAQQAQPQQQQTQPVPAPQKQNIITIEPLAVEPDTTFLRGRAMMDVYSVESCDVSDAVPRVPVYSSGEWEDLSLADFNLERISKTVPWSRCAFVRMQYYIYATEPGPHVIGLIARGFSGGWVRLNGVNVATANATGSVILQQGWYLVDVRLNYERKYFEKQYSFQTSMKRPSDQDMKVIAKDDAFLLKKKQKAQ